MTVEQTSGHTSVAEHTPPELQTDTPVEGGHGAHEGGEGQGIHLPPESLWPVTAAFGITIAAFGLVTNYLVTIPGILMFVIALRGWAQELLYAKH